MLLLSILSGPFLLEAQAPPSQEVNSQETQPTFKVQVERNVVLVRVVVRDGKGQPVGNLRKEDFRLLDNGKPQTLSLFSVETPGSKPPGWEAVAEHQANLDEAGQKPPAAPTPERFLALYFDDMLMAFEDIAQMQRAGQHFLGQGLQPTDRVGLFTSSGQNQIDFTDDKAKILQALTLVRSRPMRPREMNPCPDLGEYEAYKIVHEHDDSASNSAAEEIFHCRYNDNQNFRQQAEMDALSEAVQVMNRSENEAESSIRRLEELVRRMSILPGQRTLVMISPGFLTETLKLRMGEITDRAIRSNVIVNTFDPRGLYTDVPGGDATQRGSVFGLRADSMGYKSLLHMEELHRREDVLRETAFDTGGVFFHGSNDYDEGFRRVALLPEVYYVLGFSPQSLKYDGRFHPLKVSLVAPAHLNVQARRGYYAPRSAPNTAGQAKEEIEQAVFAQDEMHELPIQVNTQFFKVNDADTKLSILTRVDVHLIRFRKEGDRNLNNLTFVTALFDRDGKYVTAKEKVVEFHLRDGTLQKLAESGVASRASFDVKPGTYMVRQIVRDTEGGQISALNRTVEIPF